MQRLLYPMISLGRADSGNRTRLSSLGSWRSTDELYLHLSYLLF